MTKDEISQHINSLLTWQSNAKWALDNNRLDIHETATKAFNEAADKLIDYGIPVHKY